MITIWHRENGWYPVEIPDSMCTEQELEKHAALNPGTLKVEDITGKVLWEPKANGDHSVQ
jgi:hypothetical protein